MAETTLTQFLVFLVSGPGVAAALSWAVQYLPFLKSWVDGLGYEHKRLFFMAASLFFPVGATGGMIALGVAEPTPETWFKALFAGALGYMANQATHLIVRAVALAQARAARRGR